MSLTIASRITAPSRHVRNENSRPPPATSTPKPRSRNPPTRPPTMPTTMLRMSPIWASVPMILLPIQPAKPPMTIQPMTLRASIPDPFAWLPPYALEVVVCATPRHVSLHPPTGNPFQSQRLAKGGSVMVDINSGLAEAIKGVVEDVKGKAKVIIGALTGRDNLFNEGKAQQDKARAQRNAAKKEAEAVSARAAAKVAEKRQKAEQ